MVNEAKLYVYGSTTICASCVGAPSSKETEEWLRAAIGRKFSGQPFVVEYVDIFNPPNETALADMANKIVEEDLCTQSLWLTVKLSRKAILG